MNFDLFFVASECAMALFVAWLAALVLTPAVERLAEDRGFVDRPDGGRKAHARPVALGGGVAVFVAALFGVAFAFVASSVRQQTLEEQMVSRFDARMEAQGSEPAVSATLEEQIAQELSSSSRAVSGQQVREVLKAYDADPAEFQRTYGSLHARMNQNLRRQSSPFYFGLLAASLLICAVGLVDDLVGLQGRYKLIGQIAASLVLVASGLIIDKVSIFDRDYVLGIMAVPFTLFWLLGAINAVNLLDGIDGLAATVGVVLSSTLVGLFLLLPQFHQAETIVALVLAGSLLGFLRFNRAPASIFLGDCGSMMIGLIIGALAIRGSLKTEATVALAAPFAIWAIPILDSGAAILRRKLTGRSLFATDRGHLHHSLLVRGWSVRRAVHFIAAICAVTCGGAIASYYLKNEAIAWVTVLAVIVLLIVMGIFGHIEFALVRDRVRRKARAMRRSANGQRKAHESRIRLQGSQEWDHLWTAMTESAEKYNLEQMELTLNLPALHEAFYANWQRADSSGNDTAWRLSCPLLVDGRSVGTLAVSGCSPDGATLRHVGQVADFLDPVEDNLRRMIQSVQDRYRAEKAAAGSVLETPVPREWVESSP